MKQDNLLRWVSIVGIIGIVFGIFYSLFGLNGLPVYQKLVPSTVYTQWSNGLYGAVFIGFSILLFFVGRHAIKTKDKVLIKALLYGIAGWLIVEASFSLYYGVFFNAGVDVLLAIVLGLPFVLRLKSRK
ncbi:MAG TPA: hypothetical protein VF820_03655 [Patescibacteria group bacterium]